MVVALHDLQGGVEHGVVDGGGHLTDASAHAVLRAAPRVDGGGEIALVGGAASGGVVVGKLLSRQQDLLVAGRRGQLHVGFPGGASAHPGSGLPQQVLEQPASQVVLGHVGPGDGQGDNDGLTALGVPVGAFQLLHVEVHPHSVVGDGHRLQVQNRVLGFGVHLPADGLKVGLRRLALGGRQDDCVPHRAALPAEPGCKRLLQLLAHGGPRGLPVHRGHGGPLCHHQLRLGDLIAVVSGGFVDSLLHPCQKLGLGGLVLGQDQGHLGRGPQHMSQQLGAAGEKVVVAHIPGVLGAPGRVRRQLAHIQLLLQVLIDQGKADILALLVQSGLHRALGLLHRHVGDIHTGYGHVGKNRAPAAGPSARPDIGRGQHSNHSSGYDPGQLAPAFSFRLALSLHRSHLLLRSRFPGLRRAPFTCLFLKALLRQLLIL